jgi:RNA polymerase sigma-70 factor (ECF subfamily)
VAMDSIRKRKSNNLFSSLEDNVLISSINKPDENYIRKERIEIINKSIDGLSEKQKTVFLLRQHGDLTFKEISEAINEPLNTVISHMHYAVKKIKKQLAIEDEPRRKTII